MNQHDYLTHLISECYKARDSHVNGDKLQRLFDEASPFANVPVAGRGVSQAIAQKNLSKLAGALGMCLGTDGGDRVSVTQNATATANVDVSSYVNVVQSIPEPTLSEADKTVLTGMLATLQGLEGEQKKSKLMEVVKWLGDKAVDVSIAVIPMLADML